MNKVPCEILNCKYLIKEGRIVLCTKYSNIVMFNLDAFGRWKAKDMYYNTERYNINHCRCYVKRIKILLRLVFL